MTDSSAGSTPEYQHTVDAVGLACPLPILRAKKALATILPGEVLRVITTDRGAVRDFQAFCRQTGNELLTQVDEVERVTHYLKRRLKPVATTP
jgi:tRNA 2-thiouridine synthesizing protein A